MVENAQDKDEIANNYIYAMVYLYQEKGGCSQKTIQNDG